MAVTDGRRLARPAGRRRSTERLRLLVAGIALILVVGLVVGVGIRFQRARSNSGNTVALENAAPDSRSPTERQLAALQVRLHDRPDDPALLASLGQIYVQRARETGDPAYYPRAEEAFRGGVGARCEECRCAGRARLAGPLSPSVPRGPRLGPAGPGGRPAGRLSLWRHRRRADRTRHVPGGGRDLPTDGQSAPRPRLLRAGLLRAGVARGFRRGDRGDATRGGGWFAGGGGDRLDAHPARHPLLQ